MRHQLIIGSLVLLLAALPIAGCGDNDNSDNGSGGNCGNGFIDQSSESCDGSDFDGATCQSLGFAGGTLTCGPRCQRDTTTCTGSGRTPTPVVTATPGSGPTATAVDATATPTEGTNPTPTTTPGTGPTCTGSESIVVAVSLAGGDYTSARVDLKYPVSANIPGSGTETSVGDRIVFAADGLKVRNDFDSDDDLKDDTVTAGFVGTDVQSAGLFVTITFDCVAGEPQPAAGEFACTVVSASFQGTAATLSCSVALQ